MDGIDSVIHVLNGGEYSRSVLISLMDLGDKLPPRKHKEVVVTNVDTGSILLASLLKGISESVNGHFVLRE